MSKNRKVTNWVNKLVSAVRKVASEKMGHPIRPDEKSSEWGFEAGTGHVQVAGNLNSVPVLPIDNESLIAGRILYSLVETGAAADFKAVRSILGFVKNGRGINAGGLKRGSLGLEIVTEALKLTGKFPTVSEDDSEEEKKSFEKLGTKSTSVKKTQARTDRSEAKKREEAKRGPKPKPSTVTPPKSKEVDPVIPALHKAGIDMTVSNGELKPTVVDLEKFKVWIKSDGIDLDQLAGSLMELSAK